MKFSMLFLLVLPLALSAADKPNFLFILVDDMGWKDLGSYGNKIHETPNLDKLAERGMRFTNAYAACPICGPSRAAIMTGRYPCLLYTSPSPRDYAASRMPSSA